GAAAVWVHVVASEAGLSEKDRATLDKLLEYGPRIAPAVPPGPASMRVWIVPRLGTVSPWSSKATDIAHICGLALHRMERAVRWTIHGALRPDSADALAAALHDRMTETVIRDEGDLGE